MAITIITIINIIYTIKNADWKYKKYHYVESGPNYMLNPVRGVISHHLLGSLWIQMIDKVTIVGGREGVLV